MRLTEKMYNEIFWNREEKSNDEIIELLNNVCFILMNEEATQEEKHHAVRCMQELRREMRIRGI